MPAEGTGISWLEEEQPLSLCPQSLALDFDLLCSRVELAYKQGFGLGSLLLHWGGDREPGQALGFSTLPRLSQPLRTVFFLFALVRAAPQSHRLTLTFIALVFTSPSEVQSKVRCSLLQRPCKHSSPWTDSDHHDEKNVSLQREEGQVLTSTNLISAFDHPII